MTDPIKELTGQQLDQVSGGVDAGIFPLPFPPLPIPVPRLPKPWPLPIPIPRLPVKVQ